MSCQTATQTNQAPGVVPSAPWRVRDLKVLPDWQLSVTFNDGLGGTVDISELINSSVPGIFAALRDPLYFAQVYLDYGAVAWPNGADIAPEAMYEAIRQTGLWKVADE